MDLIASLTSRLGLDPQKAQGLAGAVLGQLQAQVGQKLGEGDAAALSAQIPELDEWKQRVPALEGGAGGGLLAGGLLGGAASALGGGGGLLGAAGGLLGGLGGAGGGLDIASLIQLASKAGLGAGAVEQLVPIVVEFLKSRLDPNLLARVLGAVPGLDELAAGAGGLLGGSGTGGGGLGGLLGGIL